MFAPKHHAAMRHVAPVRASLKLRTIFNLLGPLSNPAGAKRQLLGVYDKSWVRPIADALRDLGSIKAWVVHGKDGLDELSISGPTYVAALSDGEITEFEVTPAMAGLSESPISAIKGGDAEENAAALTALFDGKASAYRDIVLLNTAAALIQADKAEDLAEGAKIAAAHIDNGDAKTLLKDWIAFTNDAGAKA